MTEARPVLRLFPVLVLALLFGRIALAQEAVPRVEGIVRGASGEALPGVKIVPDDENFVWTDDAGHFRLTLPPDARERGTVRLDVGREGYQGFNLYVDLPLAAPLEIVLAPLWARGFLPALTADQLTSLRWLRSAELAELGEALEGRHHRVAVVEGPPGIGKSALVRAALHDRAASGRGEILWWECDADDTPEALAAALAGRLGDDVLPHLLARYREIENAEERTALRRQVVDRLVDRLTSSPRTLVLVRFERWLGEEYAIADDGLARLLQGWSAHPGGGVVALVSEARPALPRDLAALRPARLRVGGLAPEIAVAHLRDDLGLAEVGEELLRRVAEHWDGHPLALQLVATSVEDLPPEAQRERLRALVDGVRRTGEWADDLRLLFAEIEKHLSPQELRVLEILTVVERPLPAADVAALAGDDLLPGDAERAAESLAGRRGLLQREDLERGLCYRALEVVRQGIGERLLGDRERRLELHRRAMVWFGERVEGKIDSLADPDRELLADGEEFVRHAFEVADRASGEEADAAVVRAAEMVTTLRNWWLQLGAYRVMAKSFEECRERSRAIKTPQARRLEATCLLYDADLDRLTNHLAAAEKKFAEALPLYKTGTRGTFRERCRECRKSTTEAPFARSPMLRPPIFPLLR